MRVITGSAKGHRLKAPRGLSTRPMLDKVKESLFAVLDGYLVFAGPVLDLYAGTGSLGIECLSRGAERADFVEQSAHVCQIIRQNLRHTRLHERAQVHTMSVERYLRLAKGRADCQLVVMDPPYADPAIERTIEATDAADLVLPDGLLVVGHSPRVALGDGYGRWQRIKFRRLGDSCFSIYEQATQSETASVPDQRGSA